MIRAEVREGGVALVGVPHGAAVYVDQDWLPASSGPLPSLSVSPEGDVAWCDGRPVRPQRSLARDETAALAFLSVARAAATEVAALSPGSVEVTGSGLIAQLVRALVGVGAGGRSERPGAVVDTTGDPTAIADAVRRVIDLGTVVIAGEARGRRTELNLYTDVHARGLTLVGIPPPVLDGDFPSWDVSADEPLLESSRASLVHAEANQLLSPDAAWYCVSA